MAFSQLPEDAQVLLRVLAFFNPNHIDESLLKESILQVESPNQLKLAKRRIEYVLSLPYIYSIIFSANCLSSFSNAEKSLLQMSFINKSIDNGTITMDKSVQEEVIACMTSEERREIFSIVVHILMVDLPDTYSADVGHQFTSWSKCERLLPHIESILEQNSKYCILHGANQEFAQLLLRSSWYASK